VKMKKAIVLSIILLGGCGLSMREKITIGHKTGVMARKLVEGPEFCRPQIDECKRIRTNDPDNKCSKLSKCHDTKALILRVLSSLQRAVVVGLLSLDANDELSAKKALSEIGQAIELVRGGLADWGLRI